MLGGLLGVMLAWASMHAGAQEAARIPGTGDMAVDRQLADIDRYGSRYRDPFVDELVRYHGAPRDFVLVLIEREWSPGDIYYACALANVAGRPCRYVADQYSRGDAADWQGIARQLGVEPDSAQFQRLKRGIVATYRRWGRPLPPESPAQRSPLPQGELPAAPARAPASKLPLPPPGNRASGAANEGGDRSQPVRKTGATSRR